MQNLQIHLEHLTRVEGHGDIVVDVREGKLVESRLHIVEAPRFFESFLRDKYWYQAPEITSRICGICSIGHTMAAIRAVENAMSVEPSYQTQLLRKLLFHAETNTSHILHVYYLVAPDFFGVGSVIPLVQSHPDVVLRALRMKRLWNELAEMLVGRKIHSIALQPGGFTHLPTVKQLKDMKEKLLAGVDDLLETAKLIKAAVMPNVPNYSRDTEFVSLSKPDEYAYIDGVIKSSDGPAVDIQKYREYIKEFVVKHSSSKHCTATRDSFMVGALARFNNNYDLLNETAKSVAKDLGLEKGCNNTYAISIAQLVEVVHCHFDAIRIIDELIERGIEQESPNVVVKAGRGVGAIDVPRGLLIHDYEINEEGKVVHANCIIPTGMNLENIDKDMEKIVPEMLAAGQTKEQITLGLEMLVRAYDPCISCSCHMLNVKFINE